MKRIQSFVACAIALAFAASAVHVTAQTTADFGAKVLRLKGSARYSVAGRPWQDVHVGDIIPSGATVQTGRDGSSVDFIIGPSSAPAPQPMVANVFFDPSDRQTLNVVRIFENSVLAIDKMTSTQTGAEEVTDTQLNLQAGRIMGTVRKLSAASRYEVKIPNGVAGIRGTVYSLSAAGIVHCVVGSLVMAVVGSDGKVTTQEVLGHQKYDISTGLITTIPAVEMRDLLKVYLQIYGTGSQAPAPGMPNPTINYVSPVTPGGAVLGGSGGGGP
jgi:FecR-like protein